MSEPFAGSMQHSGQRIAPATFRTERLILKRATLEHYPEMRLTDADPQVQRTLFGVVHTPEQTTGRLQRVVAHWETHGFGYYMSFTHAGEFVGQACLFRSRVYADGDVELGYVVRPPLWKRGYATEIARALVAIAFDELELPRIFAVTEPSNIGSRRVVEKAGLRYLGELLYRDQWPSVVYGAERNSEPAKT